jgi:hypothetical protein
MKPAATTLFSASGAIVIFALLATIFTFTFALPVAAEGRKQPKDAAANKEEIVAVTRLASSRQIAALKGIKHMAIGVSPLPEQLRCRTITEDSLCQIISARVSQKVDIDPQSATHLLLLKFEAAGERDYHLFLTLTPLKKTGNEAPSTHSFAASTVSDAPQKCWELKMRASLSGHYPRRINELVQRASIIFWRNYQLANTTEKAKGEK